MTIAQYYKFTPCCEGAHPAFFLVPTIELDPVPAVYNYTGPTITDTFGSSVETGKCYLVEKLTSGAPPALTFAEVLTLSDLVNSEQFDYISDDCPDLPTVECPCVIPPSPSYSVYSLQPCCGGLPTIVYFINNSLVNGTTYVYNSVIPDGDLIAPSCYTATTINYTGKGVPPFVQVILGEFTSVPEGCGDNIEPYTSVCELYCFPCICTRFIWTGTIVIGDTYDVEYIDCNNESQMIAVPTDGVTWSDKVCLKNIISTCPSPLVCWSTETFGNCNVDATDPNNIISECLGCYELRDCTGIEPSIYTLNQQVSQYVNTQQIINIVGNDTCWRVFDSIDSCECAIAVTVDGVFDDCPSCLNPKGYKLIECTTGEIQYTTTDLSDYTTAILQTNCPGCWRIEPIDIVPPSSQPVTVITSFEDCKTCNAKFYVLTDCRGILDPIITITDLFQYIGDVVQLKFCPDTCWEVAETTPQEIDGEVIVEKSFIGCTECLVDILPCVCSTALNDTPGPISGLRYVDCEGNTIFTSPLAAGERSSKICLKYWLTGTDPIFYGDCVDGVCPVIPLTKRKVTPGYNTAVCSTDYYERVECNFSNWMYKDVLEQRYGISNCCPEELMKWEIKHEMLMLDILVNPDYECSTGNTCNCPSTCDCGYISLNIKNGTCPS